MTKFCASFHELIESGSIKTIRFEEPELEFIRGALGEIGQRGMPVEADSVWRAFTAASVAAICGALQVRFILPHLAMWLKNQVYSV
jgi:hypothetical protein